MVFDPSDRFWALSTDQLAVRLETGGEGLSTLEAARRLGTVGRNAVNDSPRRRMLDKVARRLVEPLIAILLVAAALSGATGDWASFFIILVILATSIGLDVIQEHKAEDATDALKRSVALRAQVRRDGQSTAVLVEELVPGDVVELKAGDLVPADGIVLASRCAHANEALLTGEPYPVEKRPGPADAAEPAEAYNALFGGTALVSGEAAMLVVSTGPRTRLGEIAAALASQEPPTAFERGLHALGLLIVRLTAFLVLFVLLTHLALGRPAIESFLFAVALAVGLTPELLPMVTTVTLSRGAMRMAASKVIVKRLAAIHDLGAMDVLCTDKTGTLTEARIALDRPSRLRRSRLRARDRAGLREQPVRERSSEPARRRHPRPRARAAADRLARRSDLPFDFERRRVSVLADQDGRRFLIVKGAPEEVLARSSFAEDGSGGCASRRGAARAGCPRFMTRRRGRACAASASPGASSGPIATGPRRTTSTISSSPASASSRPAQGVGCGSDSAARARGRPRQDRLGRCGPGRAAPRREPEAPRPRIAHRRRDRRR